MFTQLLASRPVRQRSTVGLVMSVVLHLSIVSAVVYLTMRVAPAAAQVITDVMYVNPAPDPLPPAPRPTTPPVDGASGAPVISVPIDVPDVLPVIPVDAGVTPVDFTTGTRFVPGDVPSAGSVPAPPPGSAYFAEQVDVVVAIANGSPVPKYPSALRPMGIDGSARFRFIVDSLGRVEMPSVEQVQATHDAFAFAVRNTLARMRFTPALVQGKPVRQLVELPFVFRVER
jgi:TonB family protein